MINTVSQRVSIYTVMAPIVKDHATKYTIMTPQQPTTTRREAVFTWKNGGGNGVDQTTTYMITKLITRAPQCGEINDGVGET